MMAVFDHIYILIIIYLFLSLLLRFNIMNYIQKKIFLYQTLFFILIILLTLESFDVFIYYKELINPK